MKIVIDAYNADLGGFNSLPEAIRRYDVLNTPWKYESHWYVLSDINGTGWYLGFYLRRAAIDVRGNIYFKTRCTRSISFKNGKFYGCEDMIQQLIEKLTRYVKDFEFIRNCHTRYFTKAVAKKILTRKITSVKDIYKEIMHTSYKDPRYSILQRASDLRGYLNLKMFMLTCKNPEAILTMTDEQIYNIKNSSIMTNCYILGEKLNCQWSEKRLREEAFRLEDKIAEIKLEQMDKINIYDGLPINFDLLPSGWKLVRSEFDAHVCATHFHNCVHSNYWRLIKRHKYIVIRNNDVCAGYQVRDDGDVLLDQIRGIMNTTVPENDYDRILRPFAQHLSSLIDGTLVRNTGTDYDIDNNPHDFLLF